MANIQKRILKNGNISYRVQVRIKGHPVETATFARLTDAKLWIQQTEADIRRGKHFKTSEAKKRTMAETIDRYFKEVLAYKKNPTNQITYLNWWKDKIGVYALADTTTAIISEKRTKLINSKNKYGRAIGTTTSNRYTQALGHVFNVAQKEWGWTSENPVKNLTKYKESRGRVRFLSDEERVSLLKACLESDNPYLYIIVVLALSTGARKMEIVGLQWKDIDFQRNSIILHETKNNERRVIPLQGLALRLIKEHAKVRNLVCPYVFPSKNKLKDKNGQTIHKPMDIRAAWENVLKKANIEDFRFHDLRHSAASYLAMNGASLTEIAEVLGHKTLQMVKRYAHLSEAHTSAVVAQMNERIFSDART
jgi:integrase